MTPDPAPTEENVGRWGWHPVEEGGQIVRFVWQENPRQRSVSTLELLSALLAGQDDPDA